MENVSHEEVRKHVKIYVSVFAALAFLTLVTVAVSYLRLPAAQAILVALVIATVKGALVAAFFMHLISERHIIFYLLVLTLVFFLFLMLLPAMTS